MTRRRSPGCASAASFSKSLPSAALWLPLGWFRAATALGHELVEFGLVLGVAQAVEKFLEFALLLFQAPQGLSPILVKGPFAAGPAVAVPAPALGSCLHPLHPPLHPLD